MELIALVVLALHRHDSEVPVMVLVCPLRGKILEKISRPGEPHAAVALFMKDPALGGEAQLNDVLAQFYRLTSAETHVRKCSRRDSVRSAQAGILLSRRTR